MEVCKYKTSQGSRENLRERRTETRLYSRSLVRSFTAQELARRIHHWMCFIIATRVWPRLHERSSFIFPQSEKLKLCKFLVIRLPPWFCSPITRALDQLFSQPTCDPNEELTCCLFRLSYKIPKLPCHTNNSRRSGCLYPLHDKRRVDLIAKSIYVRNNELFFLAAKS